MRIDFTGRNVVVTGAAGGIGAVIAAAFSRAGAHVLAPSHGTMDVCSAHSVERFFADVPDVDVVINNAGIYPVSRLLEMTPGEWRKVIETNLTGVHHCTRSAARAMAARGEGGAIVNIASNEALSTAQGHSHYVASKAGVVAYTRAAAFELGPQGIRVNAISPALIDREGIESSWPEGVASFLKRAPLGRLGKAEDVANACLFLASDAASFITGTNLVVDGGVLAAPSF